MADLVPRFPQTHSLLWPDAIVDLQNTLRDIELPSPLYIVGGAVRDAFLHRPIKDLDLATPGNAIKIARKIADVLKGDVFVMDDERGVARVLIDTNEGRLIIDVARFRGDDLLSDLRGRDFTINAMAVDLRGDLTQFIDPLGSEFDLSQKLIRRCSPDSLSDDPIRALRAVRQSVQFAMRMEAQTRQDIRAHVTQLMGTSPERVRDEFFSLLSLDRVTRALRVADRLGLLEQIIPAVIPLRGLEQTAPHLFDAWKHTLETVTALQNIFQIISYRRTDDTGASFDLGILAMQLDRFRPKLNAHLDLQWPNERPHRALMLFAALLHATGKVANVEHHIAHSAENGAICAHDLKLSSGEKKRLIQVITYYRWAQTLDETQVLNLHRYWFQLGAAGIDACLLGLADYLATVGNELQQDDWLKNVNRAHFLLDAYFNQYDTLVEPPMFVNGTTLIEILDIPPGPLIGELLTYIREAQVTGAVHTHNDAIGLAKNYLEREK